MMIGFKTSMVKERVLRLKGNHIKNYVISLPGSILLFDNSWFCLIFSFNQYLFSGSIVSWWYTIITRSYNPFFLLCLWKLVRNSYKL